MKLSVMNEFVYINEYSPNENSKQAKNIRRFMSLDSVLGDDSREKYL